jgi:fructose-1,6-bisphosphatase I
LILARFMHRKVHMLARELTLTDYLGVSSFSSAETQTILALARAGASVAGVLSRGKRAAFSGYDNVHGEHVRDYDVIANDLFVEALSQAPGCAGVHSEELVEPLHTGHHAAELLVFLDPLDGSANLDSHGLCGSIFGVAPASGGVSAASLQAGQGLLKAGYFLYSSATLLVLASRERVDLFLYDAALSSFTLAEQALRCPSRGKFYATNEARVSNWSDAAQGWLRDLKSATTPDGAPHYSLRYTGALVADAHRVLLEGGVFAYPADRASPNGKLRLQYEANPMSFVFRAAGGAATTGEQSPLDVEPTRAHQRVPLVLGSTHEVSAFEQATRR